MTNEMKCTVNSILQVMNELAPPELAESWDAVGLQVGNPDQPVQRVLLMLDVTLPLIIEAAQKNVDLIICHHPLIFSPLPAIRVDRPEQRLVFELVSRRISLIAAHTNLDAAPGGVADCLADCLGLPEQNRFPIGAYGRAADLDAVETLFQLRHRVSRTLGSSGCRINADQDRPIRRLAVFPGSFSEESIDDLVLNAVDAIVCGELKHHHGLMLASRGIAAIDAGHDVSERVVLKPLAGKLAGRLPQISFAVSDGLDYNRMAF